MPTSQSKRKAKTMDKDLINKLAGAGEDALTRIVQMPGGHRVIEALNGLREGFDELQTRLRSLDPLERRVAELEKRLAALEGKRKPAAARSRARPKPKPAAPRQTPPPPTQSSP